MMRKNVAKVLTGLMCAVVLAGCGKSADSSSIPDEPKGNAVAESEPKQVEEQPESAGKADDNVEEKSLAQRMSGKYSYHASGEEGEDEYYIMNVVNFGDNLYAFCGQAFSDGEENPEAYSFWATEFIPYDAKEMSSTNGNMVKVTELNFSVMSNAGKYCDRCFSS